jgi:hypothetical protein
MRLLDGTMTLGSERFRIGVALIVLVQERQSRRPTAVADIGDLARRPPSTKDLPAAISTAFLLRKKWWADLPALPEPRARLSAPANAGG